MHDNMTISKMILFFYHFKYLYCLHVIFFYEAQIKFFRVADADNMFMMSLERLQSFPKTQKAPDLCICEKPSLLSGTIKNTVTCTNSKGTLISCEKDKMKPVQKDVCYERHNRRKRSAKHSFTFVPKIVIKPKWKRSKVFFF